ncbi:MBL fold metallo-hydrolase [Lihuaxuella thermophila]|uniref:Ribonuclease BN, tRNA processing enzyme n=1 Tax=Lihuaxuella thermophila TaxID=1173111 RepID=A0A1H8GIB2_9BACL|nr:MBL fold metallo-hydrolase [Lihuaxuella thermophila]SEN43494.1 Ribonuclease BN, tRNA processing enzyme [Lihuaxuella thermophila]
MRWTVLGCHSPFPGPGGATPGYLLEADGKRILIDCGSGVLAQLAKKMPLYDLDAVFLSHLHHDHISDFFVLQYAIMTAIKQKKRAVPLPVWAPAEPAHWYSKLSYDRYIEKHVMEEGTEASLGNLKFSFYRTDHAIPCYAMKIKEDQRILLYGADSGPKTNWTRMADSPDLFVCEATYLHKDLPSQPTGHLSARQAAEAALDLRAKKLLLTHLYPDYDPKSIQQEARSVFASSIVAETGLSIMI